MKKNGVLRVLLVLMLVFVLAACGEAGIKGFARGEWDGSTYTSEFADLKVEVPSEWAIATDEELASLMNIGMDAMMGENELASKIIQAKTVYDAMAQNTYTGSNVIVMYENLSLSVGGSSLDEVEYLNIVKSQLGESAGDIEEVKIGDYTYQTLTTEMPSYGIKQVYYVRRVENYMSCIITTAVGDEDLTSIIK